MDVNEVLRELTLEEKIALVSGTNFMYTNPIKRLGIKSVRMSDGPHGLRVQKENGDNGVSGSDPSTCFPTAVTSASGFNPKNVYKMGEAMAEEACFYGIDVILGPGINIKRNPLCGRNFEYFSEDPLIAGVMGASEIKGIQSKNVGTSLKHFALNSQENYRFMGDSICDERAIREIYLKGFEKAVKEANPETVMCSYNKINGVYSCENDKLLNQILRKEWGYNGLVMSDWGATHNRVNGVKSGLDLEMPGDTAICRKWLEDAVINNELDIKYLDKAVLNVLNLINKHEKQEKTSVDWQKHHKLAIEIATDSAVLLKNEDMLPLTNNDKILVVGDLFKKMRYQGAGSSMINPQTLSTPFDAFNNNQVNYEYVVGYRENNNNPDKSLIEEACMKAKGCEKVLVFIGLTDYVESEGCDRDNMKLPLCQVELINELVKVNNNIILVMFGGSPFELPFKDNVKAILNMYLPGEGGGEACYQLLYGLKNPSGKLAETWPKSYSDVLLGNNFSKQELEIYKESIFVGYRYYNTFNVDVNYPFGYGLSYTKFEYSNINLKQTKKQIKVSFDLENIGSYDGAEIAQVYVKGPKGILKPISELKAFDKVYLEKKEKKTVELVVDVDDLRYWSLKQSKWVLEDGEYTFLVQSSSRDIKLEDRVYIKGESLENEYPKELESLYLNNQFENITNEQYELILEQKIVQINKKKITIDTRFSEYRHSKLLGRIIYKAVLGVATKQLKEAKKLRDGIEKENKIKGAIFLQRILDSNSIMTLSMSGGKNLPYNFAQGFVHFGNGKLIKGIKAFTTPVKAPKLPKEGE